MLFTKDVGKLLFLTSPIGLDISVCNWSGGGHSEKDRKLPTGGSSSLQAGHMDLWRRKVVGFAVFFPNPVMTNPPEENSPARLEN